MYVVVHISVFIRLFSSADLTVTERQSLLALRKLVSMAAVSIFYLCRVDLYVTGNPLSVVYRS